MSANPKHSTDLLQQLSAAIGREHVLSDPAEREFYAMDVYNFRELPLAVVRPGAAAELQAVVRIAAAAGIALVPRGGGASYTDGYLPATPESLLIDTSRMNRIVEINEEDMYVTVEPAVTWHDLWQALKARNLRSAFWGPFSGIKATVGGSASQNSASLGTGNYGISADAILGFEIVLANGEILRTGAHAAANGRPFFRWYGPDLTGLFCGDAGALGIKASISLRLIRQPPFDGAASFGFGSFEQMAAGMAAAARENVAADNFALDPKLQQGQLSKTDTKGAVTAALAVAKTARNPFEAAGKLARMGAAGKRFLAGHDYSAHYTVEGVSRAEVNGKLTVLRQAMAGHGEEIANTVPTVIRAMPFMPLYAILGPKGERWVPMHGIMPFSRVREFHERLTRLYADNAERMRRHKVDKGGMFLAVSTHGFLYEPVFYWEDDRTAFHKRYLPAEYLKTLPEYPANPDGRALVGELRGEIRRIFASVGAIHMQVGKTYPYMDGRQGEAARALRELKQQLDPQGIMNPGALQL
ncbi:MAG: FAD-binding oxidoreductase [Gammaproteobacteria bacterium]|nr:MAG: FAD-binding oxidoreductase [Gammaproteobacteria bacterium]